MTTSYLSQFEDTFMTAGQNFGDAHTTSAEFGALRALYVESGQSRQQTLDSIIESGYPQPVEITAEMVALSGAAHACGVAISLAESRGEDGRSLTYESYTLKNRFDRFVYLHLPVKLKETWSDPIEREAGHSNQDVKYPDGVDEALVHGINKPSRFFTAQTIRYVELARLGKLDEKTKKELDIDDRTDLEKYRIDWSSLIPAIEYANDLSSLAGDLGALIAEQLLKNGLYIGQVAKILNAGFNVRAMAREHGDLVETDETIDALRYSLRLSSVTRPLTQYFQ